MSEYWDDDCDYDDRPDDPCEHDEQYVDVDILSGRALCLSCGHAWWMSNEASEAMEQEAAEADTPLDVPQVPE